MQVRIPKPHQPRSARAGLGVLLLTLLAACSDDGNFVPPSGTPGPNAHPNFPSYAAQRDQAIDRLANAPVAERDAYCQTYCKEVMGWQPPLFQRSSITDFFQTPEKTDLRCDYAETNSDIRGSEQHLGSWIHAECSKRGARNCYWSINYGKPHGGRVACVRPVFAP
ncbi:hypothetical protein [Uliginosibacterium sp. H1]|uniref:hypothetical protein n=1 Tax=Uliginosibacterium sp. H1 TaxID=3114757 RepID=UPI002E19EE8F|nr:hypothetical protein [Uliginosibacterium sp. H1]